MAFYGFLFLLKLLLCSPGKPRHIDSQDTLPLNRGDSLAMDFRKTQEGTILKDPVLDLAHTLQVRGDLEQFPELCVPDNADTCLDMARSPGRLCQWVNRFGSDVPIEHKAWEVLKWVRIVAGARKECFEEEDSIHGPTARLFHKTCVNMLYIEEQLQAAKQKYDHYARIIVQVGDRKRQQEKSKELPDKTLRARLAQVDRWEVAKLQEKEAVHAELAEELRREIGTFSESLLLLVTSVENELKATSANSQNDNMSDGLDEGALCRELDDNLLIFEGLADPRVPGSGGHHMEIEKATASPVAVPQSIHRINSTLIIISTTYPQS